MSRGLEIEDLSTPIGLRRSIRPNRCLSPSPRRCIDSPLCSPCPPRCYSSSPSVRRRRPTTRCKVPQRDLKSGRMVCDKFTSVCYPRNLSKYCDDFGDVCPPRYRKPISCTPTSCYRSCTPPRCPRGICRVSCRCPPPPPAPPYCPPCSPCDDECEPDPSDRFVQAMKNTGPCTSRYQTHLCPWEADVTVSGTIRAHCTSTADEISNRLAGPFKAFGKRFTTDTECNWPSCEPCCDQKLSLGMLDDGGCLDFSRNNRLTSDSSSLDYRVKRIMSRTGRDNRKATTPSRSLRDTHSNHISWDRSLDHNHSRDDGTRYSGRYNNGERPSNLKGRRNNPSYQDTGNLRRHSNDGPHGEMGRGNGSAEDDRIFFDRHQDETLVRDRRRHVERYQSDGRSSGDDRRLAGNPSFEIMMNRRNPTTNKRRFHYTSTQGRYSNKLQSDSEYDDGYNTRRGKSYESGGEADDEEKQLPTRYRTKQRTEYGFGNRSRNHYGYHERGVENDRELHDKDYRFNKASYYDSDYNTSKMEDDSYGSSGLEGIRFRSRKDMADLDRIRFWPCSDDRE